MSDIYALGAMALSVTALALFLLRLGAGVRLSIDGAAAGAALCATVGLLFLPFDLLANPMRFAPQTLAFGFAGLPEEALKMLGFAAFLRPHWRARSPRDVMLAAGALALGFAALENFFYVVRAGADGAAVAASRAATAAPMHVLEGIAGGYVVARAPANGRGVAAGVLAWLGLAALHGVYDLAYFASRPDAVRFVAFDDVVAALGLDGQVTLRVLADLAEATTALAAAAALRASPPAPQARGLGGTLAATLIAAGLATAIYGAGAAYAADAWRPFAGWIGFALLPFALGLMSLPAQAPVSRRWLVGAGAGAALMAAAAAFVWGPAGWRWLDMMHAQSQGARFYVAGDFERAAAAYGRAVESAPGRVEPLAGRAAAYSGARRYLDALADLDRALSLTPTGRLYAQRAELDEMRNLPADARADLDAALKFDVANPRWLAERALAKLESGDAEGAALDLALASRTAPNEPSVRRIAALWDVNQGDFDAALRELNARLHDDPHDRQALFERGRGWFYKGDYGRARDDFAAASAAQATLYPALWLALAQARLREPAPDALRARLGASADWPAPLARMLRGELTPEAARAQAHDDDQRCEADFFFAASRLSEDASDVNAGRLRAVRDECPKNFIEYEAAVALLKRLAL